MEKVDCTAKIFLSADQSCNKLQYFCSILVLSIDHEITISVSLLLNGKSQFLSTNLFRSYN